MVNRTAEPCATTRSKIQAIFIDHLNKTAEFFRFAITFPAYSSLGLIKTSRIPQHSTVTFKLHGTADKTELSRFF